MRLKDGLHGEEFLSAAAAGGRDNHARSTVGCMAQDCGAAMVEAKLAVDPMRPQFHLLPARNWMNDPNGPIYYQAASTTCSFQYNPLARGVGRHELEPRGQSQRHAALDAYARCA